MVLQFTTFEVIYVQVVFLPFSPTNIVHFCFSYIFWPTLKMGRYIPNIKYQMCN